MHKWFVSRPSNLAHCLAIGWGLCFLVDGLLRLFVPTKLWLFRAIGTNIEPHMAQIFSGMGWPILKLYLLLPFVGCLELTIAAFLAAALYEMRSLDSDDSIPGTAMLAMGLAMALAGLGVMAAAGVASGHAKQVIGAIWPLAMALAASLLAVLGERAEGERRFE
ncbi:hypothetical protein E8L99_20610 [Phreatobacter aquaticus]|uniref:Uncharacterized protein n=1 Tax=Phreatobacter aquaticus TaxID=2570229 RepID=A0A4D7QPU1_9HYPH|nr:hypothetical protein [Phreatobacter aquaticus]QCK87983.1 hypothetical protein E8L99_20610 [Phreatobacter aquaticus]